ncbi:phage tail assembly protein T [Endozoicomonas lisbonensis]
MPLSTYLDWWAFYHYEPWGYYINQYNMGTVGALVANGPSVRTDKRAWRPSDFYYHDVTPTVPEQTMDDQISMLRAMKGQRL